LTHRVVLAEADGAGGWLFAGVLWKS